MSDINIEFFVMKRKLWENVNFPQQRIQRIKPADGKQALDQVKTTFLEFINECFTPQGEPNREHRFLKNPGKAKKHCKYCVFKTLIDPKTGEKYCDGKEG